MYAKFVVRNGGSVGRISSLRDGEHIIVGRSSRAGLFINDTNVSREHCILENKGNYIFITDLGSTNGTFLNDKQIVSSHVNNGDIINLGGIEIGSFVLGDNKRHPSATVEKLEQPIKRDSVLPSDDDPEKKLIVSIEDVIKEGVDTISKRSIQDLHSLYTVANSMSEDQSLTAVFNDVAREILETLDADRVGILVRGQGPGSINPIVLKTRSKSDNNHEFAMSYSVIDDVITKGMAILSSDATTDQRYRARQSIVIQHISSIMCVPIRGKEGILGAIYVDSFSAARSFSKNNLELLSAIGHQAGIAIERFQLIERLEHLFIGTIRTLVAAVDAKDKYTHGHSERVTTYSLALCDVLGLSRHERNIVELAGLLHDVGKIGVPENVLNKPARLTTNEFSVIKQHPASGASIIRNIEHEYINEVALAIRGHHERWDGRGYPDGLNAEEASLAARILTVTDAYDAMTSNRPYRQGFDQNEAIMRLLSSRGQFDEDLARAFCDVAVKGVIFGANKYSAEVANRDSEAATSAKHQLGHKGTLFPANDLAATRHDGSDELT